MFLRLVADSFRRRPRHKLLTGAALALGMAVATAALSVSLDVGDRLSHEFRSLGANLASHPASRHPAPRNRRRRLPPGKLRRLSPRIRPPQNQNRLLAQQHHRFQPDSRGPHRVFHSASFSRIRNFYPAFVDWRCSTHRIVVESLSSAPRRSGICHRSATDQPVVAHRGLLV